MPTDRVLVVDDEPRVLSSMCRCLRLAGFRVLSAGLARDALTLCDAHSFDVVILDLIMPGMDGVELLARIRKVQPLVRSVVLSGKIDEDLAERDIARKLRESVEADAYLSKPVSGTRLVETVRGVIVKDPPGDWKAIAKRMSNGKDLKIKTAKDAAKELKKFRKK